MSKTTWGGYQSPDLDPREGDQPVARLVYQDERSPDKNRIDNLRRQVEQLEKRNELLIELLNAEGIYLCPSCGGVNDQRDPDQPCTSCQYEAAEAAMEGDR